MSDGRGDSDRFVGGVIRDDEQGILRVCLERRYCFSDLACHYGFFVMNHEDDRERLDVNAFVCRRSAAPGFVRNG